MRTLAVLLLSLGLLAAAPAPFTPYLVKDINLSARTGDSDPGHFFALGNLALFQVWRIDHAELWRTDGTASGTYRLVEDLGHGSGVLVVGAGDRCFFRLQAPDGSRQLWVTDGTLPGTHFVSEVTADTNSGPAVWLPRQGVLYFVAGIYGQGHGIELWRSDGTPGGTYEVSDLAPGPDSSLPSSLTIFRGRVYFAAQSALWRSDGTATGTAKVRDVRVDSLQVVGSRLVFVGADAQGSELWASDGTTEGTRRIADLAKGAASTSSFNFQIVGKHLFFSAWTSDRGRELYVTDGTSPGTQRLTRFSDPYALEAGYMAPLGGQILFWAHDSSYSIDLWVSDGTPNGTHKVPGACPVAYSCFGGPLVQHRGRLYYGIEGTDAPELWVTDGTTEGSRKVKDIPNAERAWPAVLGTIEDRLLFVTHHWDRSSTWIWATDGTSAGTQELAVLPEYEDLKGESAGGLVVFSGVDSANGTEPWISDGTPQGTHLLVDIAVEDVGGSHPREMMSLGDRALFFARDDQGVALWRSDGTEAGTAIVKRGLDGQTLWTASASRVYFTTYQHHGVSELWTSDGSEAGTVRATPEGVSCKRELSAPVIKLGSRVFFSARDWTHGTEPWISDGTLAGTRRVADLNPGPDGSDPRDFTVFAGRAWFAASLHLWKSDGTAQGTIALGPELQEIRPWTAFGGRLWFTGRNRAERTELWSTDGTAAHTLRLAELQTIESLTVNSGRLWFLGNGTELWSTGSAATDPRKLDLPVVPHQPFRGLLSDGSRLYLFGPGLWVSDGTATGTRQISARGGYSLDRSGFWLPFGGRLYYVNDGGSLCASDGTAQGTGPVRPDGEPRYTRLFRFGDRLVALDFHGELWLSDGSAAGTNLLRDLSPTDYDQTVLKAGPRLFFPAWDEEHGWELWALRE